MTHPLIKLLTLGSLLVGSLAWAEPDDPPWYRVELLIFSQPTSNIYREHWDRQLIPQPQVNAIELHSDPTAPDSPRLLPSAERQLPVSTALMRREGMPALLHEVWQQPLLEREQAHPIRIRAGELMDNGFYQLEGDITLDIARYLHLRTNLYYTLEPPADWTPSPTPTARPAVADTASAAWSPVPSVAEQPSMLDTRLLTVAMKQGRRMRGDQLHYLDHPLFGLLIKLTRIETPPTAAAASPIPEGFQSVSGNRIGEQPPQ